MILKWEVSIQEVELVDKQSEQPSPVTTFNSSFVFVCFCVSLEDFISWLLELGFPGEH